MTNLKIPCEECILYAICKQREYIDCDLLFNFLERIFEVVNDNNTDSFIGLKRNIKCNRFPKLMQVNGTERVYHFTFDPKLLWKQKHNE